MRRKLVLITISLLMVASSAAFADRGRHKHKHHKDRVVVRDHRDHHARPRHHHPKPKHHHPKKHHHHKHVRVSNGRYVFPGGIVRVYKRPVIRHRYTNRHVRPPVIVEHYDPVPGYVWVRGSWTWGGSEWVWTPGYWAVESAPPPPPPTATMSGGISVRAGISIR